MKRMNVQVNTMTFPYQCRQNGCKFSTRNQCDLRRGIVPSLTPAQKQTLHMIDLSHRRECKGPLRGDETFRKPVRVHTEPVKADPYALKVCARCQKPKRNIDFCKGRNICKECHNAGNRMYRARMKRKSK